MNESGGCSCGTVRYELRGAPLWTQMCYCHDCQRVSGSSYGLNLFVLAEDLNVQGETRTKDLPTATGNGYTSYFCGECGTSLWGWYRIAPAGLLVLRAGTLDETDWVTPQAQVFVASKQPWVPLVEGVPAYEARCEASKVWPQESLNRLSDAVENTRSQPS
jgi:hypothetical protein